MHDNKDEIEYQMRIRVFASLANTGIFFQHPGRDNIASCSSPDVK